MPSMTACGSWWTGLRRRRRDSATRRCDSAVPARADPVLEPGDEDRSLSYRAVLSGLLVHHHSQMVAVSQAESPSGPLLHRNGAHHQAQGCVSRGHEVAPLPLQSAVSGGGDFLLGAPPGSTPG